MQQNLYENIHKWQRASNYLGDDLGEYYVIYSRHRDSDILNLSNWQCLIRDFDQFIKEHGDDYFIPRFGDFLVGWSELILVHESQTNLLKYCNTAIGKINDYPVYDDDHHSNMQMEELEKFIKQETDYFLSDHSEDIDYECKTYFKDYEPIEDKLYGAVFSKYIEMEFTPDEDQYPDAKDIESVFVELGIFGNLNVLINKADKFAHDRGHYLALWEKVTTDYYKRLNHPSLFSQEHWDSVKQTNPESQEKYKFANSHCLNCSAEVQVIPKPMPNEIAIGGTAVAINCEVIHVS